MSFRHGLKRMNTDRQNVQTNGARARTGVMKLGGTTEKIIGVFFDVYNELGHGFLESVYEGSMALAR